MVLAGLSNNLTISIELPSKISDIENISMKRIQYSGFPAMPGILNFIQSKLNKGKNVEIDKNKTFFDDSRSVFV